MAKSDFTKNYQDQSEEYRNKFSRDEFRGQKATNARDLARSAAKKEQGGKLSREQRNKIRGDNPVSTQGRQGSQYYTKGEDGKRQLTDIGKGSNPFKVKDLKDFDLAAYGAGSARGAGRLNVNDARRLMKEGGFSAQQLSDYAGSLGEGKVAKRAQRFLDRRLNKPAQPETDAQIDEGSETPTTTSEQQAVNLKNKTVTDIKQTQSFDREFGDNQNTIGDNARIYGNLNQGNQDFSVNIGSQSASAGSGSGNTYSSDLDGASIAARYGALNENAYERSRAKLTGTGQAAKYSALAEDMVGSEDTVAGLDTATDELSTYYRELADKQSVMAFGDYKSKYYTAPKWNAPAAPANIEVNYEPSNG